VVRVHGSKPRGPGFEVVDLERSPLVLLRINEELLERKVAAPVYKTDNNVVGVPPR
jgi:hypothetical protein